MQQLYPKNKLILGDCLEVMKKMEAESIDLIYLDPPFFSNRNYEVIWGDDGEVRSFEDRWAGGMDHYIGWLYDRVKEMYRLLKPSGSMYLHCDWHADAYIRVGILDDIFGRNNFVNEIVWCYATPSGSLKRFGRKHDNIFLYSKSEEYKFSMQYVQHKSGLHNSGQMWNKKAKEQNVDGIKILEEKGKKLEDWWTDIYPVDRVRSERIGYPTQKPLALLERIIKASSNEGDVVLDPFMGGGTSVVMASRLSRNFIGIDQSVAALDVTANRLKSDGLFANFEIEKHFYAEEDLKAMPHFEFERWIIEKFGGTPNAKQSADGGSDGEKDGAPIQVKRWRNKVGRPEIQKFNSVCQSKSKFKQFKELGLPVGYFIAFDFAKEAVEELARLRMKDGIIIEKVLVCDIVPMSKRPSVNISWRLLEDGRYEFVAASAENIINFSWDFAYPVPAHKHPEEVAELKPTVLFDKKGVQIHNFSSQGVHNVAVKVVDDKYLENIAVCSVGG